METKKSNEKVVIISYKIYEELKNKYDQLCLEYEFLRNDYFNLLEEHTNECLTNCRDVENYEM